MIKIIDSFFKWLTEIKSASGLIIRLLVLIVVGGLSIAVWFISIPLLAWYLYHRFANVEAQDWLCHNCKKLNNDHDDFCTNCDSESNNINPRVYTEVLNSIDGIIIALLCKIANSDKLICEHEASFLCDAFNILSEIRDDETQTKKIYQKIVEQEKDNLDNIDKFCRKLSLIEVSQEFKIDIIRIFVELAFIDSTYDKNQEDIIKKILHSLNVDFSEYQSIKNEFELQNSSKNIPTAT